MNAGLSSFQRISKHPLK